MIMIKILQFAAGVVSSAAGVTIILAAVIHQIIKRSERKSHETHSHLAAGAAASGSRYAVKS